MAARSIRGFYERLRAWVFAEEAPPVSATYTTGTGQVLLSVHDPSLCAGRHCTIHNPSDHAMRDFPTHFRTGGIFDIKPAHMERLCPHGIGHPDPDDAAQWKSRGVDIGVHGCDGCCSA